jgi:CheY-like chemotaxis protein
MPTLLVKHPEKGEIPFKLTGDRITVGRRADNDIQINHGTISGHHAELVSLNGHYVLKDLDSTNHCFIDGFQVSEVELNERCHMMLGTIPCEYIPDPETAPLAALSGPATQNGIADADLRKLVGALRHQNEELIQKINEQQNQIDILGSARLLTPATGADLTSLRAQVKTLTAERDRVTSENRGLLAEVDRLRAVLAMNPEAATLKATVPILGAAPEPDKPTVAISASGDATVAAPMAKVAEPAQQAPQVPSAFSAMTGLSGRLPTLLKKIAEQPSDTATRNELASVSTQLVERANELGVHSAARLVSSLDALVRDIAKRPVPISQRIRTTIEQANDLLGRMLSPEISPRCASLPSPGVVVVEDDKDLLPAILASLEVARLDASGINSAEDALAAIHAHPCDLVLLDIGLPGLNGLDLCSHIRSLPKHGRTPIVFLTGLDGPEQRGQGALNGGSDFIAKPFNMFELTLKAHTWAVKNQLGLA